MTGSRILQDKVMSPRKRSSHKTSLGRKRARRPRTGDNKRLVISLSEEEKRKIEHAAAEAGLSMARFIVERTLEEAERVLSKLKS